MAQLMASAKAKQEAKAVSQRAAPGEPGLGTALLSCSLLLLWAALTI
jgi:hypothetical protein